MTEITQADRDAANEAQRNAIMRVGSMHDAFARHREQAAAEERAKIVAWLRELPDEVVKAAIDRANAMARQTTEGAFRIVAAALADAIEKERSNGQ